MVTTSAVAAPYFLQCDDFGCKSTQEIRYFNPELAAN